MHVCRPIYTHTKYSIRIPYRKYTRTSLYTVHVDEYMVPMYGARLVLSFLLPRGCKQGGLFKGVKRDDATLTKHRRMSMCYVRLGLNENKRASENGEKYGIPTGWPNWKLLSRSFIVSVTAMHATRFVPRQTANFPLR